MKKPLYLGLAILFFDMLSKFFIQRFLPTMSYDTLWYPYGGIGIFRNLLGIEFSINHITNKGAAWGMLADFQEYLLFLRIACILGIVIYMLFYNQNRTLNFPCALIIAGAIGNVLDFFIYGHVIDMFHFVFWGYSYPVFNIADSAIFIGVFWLFFTTSFGKQKRKAS